MADSLSTIRMTLTIENGRHVTFVKEAMSPNPGPYRVPTPRPGQWLYLIANEGVIYSETLTRFVGLGEAGVAAYQAFDAGATVEDLVAHTGQSAQGATDELKTLYALTQGEFPPEEPRATLPALQHPAVANFEVLDIPVLVEFPPGASGSLCLDCFRSCPPSTRPAEAHVSARREKNGWAIAINGHQLLAALEEEQLGLGYLHATRTLLYAESRYDVAFHAAMVADDTCGLLLCAPREAGKSTLAAYMVSLGLNFVTDEPALLDLDTGCVSSLCLPASLKEPSWTILRDGWPNLEESPIHRRSDGTRIRLVHPPRAKFSAGARQLSHILFPQYRPGATALARRLSPLEALNRLNRGGMILTHQLPLNKFDAFLKMACALPAYALEYASLSEAASLIGALTKDGTGGT